MRFSNHGFEGDGGVANAGGGDYGGEAMRDAAEDDI